MAGNSRVEQDQKRYDELVAKLARDSGVSKNSFTIGTREYIERQNDIKRSEAQSAYFDKHKDTASDDELLAALNNINKTWTKITEDEIASLKEAKKYFDEINKPLSEQARSLEEQAAQQKESARILASIADQLNVIGHTASAKVYQDQAAKSLKEAEDTFNRSLKYIRATALSENMAENGVPTRIEHYRAEKTELVTKFNSDKKALEKTETDEAIRNEKIAALEAQLMLDVKKSAARAGLDTDKFGALDDDVKVGASSNIKLKSAMSIFDGSDDNILTESISTAVESMPQLAVIVDVLSSISAMTSAMVNVLDKGMESAMNIAQQYMASIDSHLEGLNLSFTGSDGIMSWLSTTFAINPYVSQESLIRNIAGLAEKGITYNIQQRALIETIKDKMVASFDAIDTSLLRLVRLQQADLTAQELGLEGALTEFLNRNYADSSYLATGIDDSIRSTLSDALSQFNYTDMIGFEYAVQKWLGSLYSLGLSDSTVNKLATGIGYLTTGNVEDLTNDNGLTTLFGMAAKNAGLSLAEILTEGLNESSVNTLLKSVVTYLQDIVSNTENQVTKSAWSGILGMSISDMRAIENITNDDITTIYDSVMDYESATSKFSQELSNITSRMTIGEMISNITSNALLTIGEEFLGYDEDNGLAGAVRYLTWQASNMLVNSGNVVLSAAGQLMQLVDAVTIIPDLFNDIIGSVSTNLGGTDYLALLATSNSIASRGADYTGITGVSASSAAGITGSGSVTNDVYNSSNNSVATGISLSVGYNTAGDVSVISASANDTSYDTFTSNASTVTASSVSSATSTESAGISELYDALFITQMYPIRVKLASVEDQAKTELNTDVSRAILEQLQYGTTPVSINETSNTINSLSATIAAVRG